MLDDFGESKVTVKKVELLEALRTNRTSHVKLYEDALIGYRNRLLEFFTEQLDNLKGNKEARTSFGSAAPICRTKDYDVVIRMLEMSTADEISVSQQQFQQYVMDDWSWSQQVRLENLAYSRAR